MRCRSAYRPTTACAARRYRRARLYARLPLAASAKQTDKEIENRLKQRPFIPTHPFHLLLT
jgi:hypothetical protein